MERVPQIRLFGTSQSWKHNPSSYQKKFTETFSAGVQGFDYQSRPTFQRSFESIQKSNSVSQLNTNKPSQSNYYQNAIKICQQNQILNNIKGHNAGSFVASYLTTNHSQHSLKRPCTLCQAQAITKNLNHLKQAQLNPAQNSSFQQVKVNVPYQRIHLQSSFYQHDHNVRKVSQNTKRACNQSSNFFVAENEDDRLINTKNPMVIDQPSTQMHKMSQKFVSFKQITNIPATDMINEGNSSEIQGKNINTQRNQSSPNFNPQAKYQTVRQSKMQSNSKNLLIQNFLVPQITQLISQLSLDDSETINTSYMLTQLEEMTQKHLQKRKSCIQKLDSILQNCQKEKNSDFSSKAQQTIPSLDFWLNENRRSDEVVSPSSTRRNKIF